MIAAAVVFVGGLGFLVLPRQGPSTAPPQAQQAQRQADGARQHHAQPQAQVPPHGDRDTAPEQGQVARDARRDGSADVVTWWSAVVTAGSAVVQAVSAAFTLAATVALVLIGRAQRDISAGQKAISEEQKSISANQAEIMRRQADISADQLVAAKDAAAAAVASAEASRLALAHGREVFLSTERPWISVDVSPVRLVYNENGCFITVIFVLRNVGRSPAANVDIDAEAVAPVLGTTPPFSPADIQRRISDRAREQAPPTNFGEVIFPGDRAVFKYSFQISKSDMDLILQKVSFIHPYIIGCVGYSFVFEPGNHQTGFIYDVRRSDRPRPESQAKNRSPSALFPDEGDIAQDDLRLFRFFMGFYAD